MIKENCKACKWVVPADMFDVNKKKNVINYYCVWDKGATNRWIYKHLSTLDKNFKLKNLKPCEHFKKRKK